MLYEVITNKCTNICPKDVRPEGVMKALAHWLEDEGHTTRSNPTLFDEEFTRQCLERGRIEDSEVMFNFFKKTGVITSYSIHYTKLYEYAINTDFNPRYWIYCTNLGLTSEIVKDKDIIWQCVSCNKCTYACPRDVVLEAVMKATSHWLELKGHTPKSPSMHFDEVFRNNFV